MESTILPVLICVCVSASPWYAVVRCSERTGSMEHTEAELHQEVKPRRRPLPLHVLPSSDPEKYEVGEKNLKGALVTTKQKDARETKPTRQNNRCRVITRGLLSPKLRAFERPGASSVTFRHNLQPGRHRPSPPSIHPSLPAAAAPSTWFSSESASRVNIISRSRKIITFHMNYYPVYHAVMWDRRHEGVVREACGGQTPATPAAARSCRRGPPPLPPPPTPPTAGRGSRCFLTSRNEDLSIFTRIVMYMVTREELRRLHIMFLDRLRDTTSTVVFLSKNQNALKRATLTSRLPPFSVLFQHEFDYTLNKVYGKL
ncbi:hypothetical protein E2C01_024564 [Portunus trituberculatus]|uniref:Uncharacterized protein n=1 Tax=Portunus trituberculatus TaxID=210409 RepID=A0A5B7ED64_PORTR|nr:hypothetical protein [Portunus trituberculatus]